jgi:hypothetical protein
MGSDFIDFSMFVDFVQEWVSISPHTLGIGMGFVDFARIILLELGGVGLHLHGV